jgi:hypothetical protein
MNSPQMAHVLNIVWPLIIVQVLFQVYAIYDLFSIKSGRTRNLSAAIWAVILLIGGLLGPAAYFLIGRSED